MVRLDPIPADQAVSATLAHQPYPVTASAVGVKIDATEILRSFLLGLASAVRDHDEDAARRTGGGMFPAVDPPVVADPIGLLRTLADAVQAEEDAAEDEDNPRGYDAAVLIAEVSDKLLRAAQEGGDLPFDVVLSEDHANALGADLLVGAEEAAILRGAANVGCSECGHPATSRHVDGVGCLAMRDNVLQIAPPPGEDMVGCPCKRGPAEAARRGC
jgi:hypothetical protein